MRVRPAGRTRGGAGEPAELSAATAGRSTPGWTAGRCPRRGPVDARGAAADRRAPGVRAPDLAASLGRETLPLKRDVRKLKELGLTHSLEVGYELTPGAAPTCAECSGRIEG